MTTNGTAHPYIGKTLSVCLTMIILAMLFAQTQLHRPVQIQVSTENLCFFMRQTKNWARIRTRSKIIFSDITPKNEKLRLELRLELKLMLLHETKKKSSDQNQNPMETHFSFSSCCICIIFCICIVCTKLQHQNSIGGHAHKLGRPDSKKRKKTQPQMGGGPNRGRDPDEIPRSRGSEIDQMLSINPNRIMISYPQSSSPTFSAKTHGRPIEFYFPLRSFKEQLGLNRPGKEMLREVLKEDVSEGAQQSRDSNCFTTKLRRVKQCDQCTDELRLEFTGKMKLRLNLNFSFLLSGGKRRPTMMTMMKKF